MSHAKWHAFSNHWDHKPWTKRQLKRSLARQLEYDRQFALEKARRERAKIRARERRAKLKAERLAAAQSPSVQENDANVGQDGLV